jgi:hypothetical protein
MTHYAARQHSITERWAYTCRQGGDIWPVGRCAEDGGHDTAEQAQACYRQHLIESAEMSVQFKGDYQRCRAPGCTEPTTEAAMYNGAPVFLCEEHMDEDFLEKIVPSVGTSISL